MQPPPPLGSRRYLRDYNEVKRFGAVESHPAVGACPAPSKSDMARFWSGNFISQWNEAVRLVALDQQLSIGKAARLMALANLAAADAAITVWDSKYTFNFWRPITAIREGHLDGNNGTVGDPAWTPFISSAHFPAGSQTPPYPDYTSGANGLTGAIVTTLQLFFNTNKLNFEVYKATPASAAICTNPRLYQRLSDAAQEVVDARVFSAFTSALPTRWRDVKVRASRSGCSRGSCGRSTMTTATPMTRRIISDEGSLRVGALDP